MNYQKKYNEFGKKDKNSLKKEFDSKQYTMTNI